MPVSDDHAVEPIACVGAHEADIAKDAVVAADAVVATEEETALLAQLLVPNNDPLNIPINDPVNDPVLI
jgi:DNA-directed RNA polymerase subunit H (RpoH/RPB5)